MLRQSGLVKLHSTRSVRLCFRNSGRVTFGHMAIGALTDLGLVSEQFVSRAFKFALVRDPYERAVSLYRFLTSVDVLQNWHEIPSFSEFLRILAEGHYDRIGAFNWRGLSQCNPQVAWLNDTPADKIYKVEELGDFVSDISERWRIRKPDVEHLNSSAGRAKVELDRSDTQLIEQIYAEDFETLGYRKR